MCCGHGKQDSFERLWGVGRLHKSRTPVLLIDWVMDVLSWLKVV
jgi:hypothetical protein